MTASNSVVCLSCGKKYRVKPEMAGKRVKCGCGAAIHVPVTETDAADDGLGGLIDEAVARGAAADAQPNPSRKPSVPAPVGAMCPSCGTKVSPGAVICIQCGTNLRSGKRVSATTAGKSSSGETGSSSKLWMMIGGAAVAIVVVIILMNLGGGATPAPTPATGPAVASAKDAGVQAKANEHQTSTNSTPVGADKTTPAPVEDPPKDAKSEPPAPAPEWPLNQPVKDYSLPPSVVALSADARRVRDLLEQAAVDSAKYYPGLQYFTRVGALLARMGDQEGFEAMMRRAQHNLKWSMGQGVHDGPPLVDMIHMANAYLDAGDVEAFREHLRVSHWSNVKPEWSSRWRVVRSLFEAQLRAGDYGGAQETLDSPLASTEREYEAQHITALQSLLDETKIMGQGARDAGILNPGKLLVELLRRGKLKQAVALHQYARMDLPNEPIPVIACAYGGVDAVAAIYKEGTHALALQYSPLDAANLFVVQYAREGRAAEVLEWSKALPTAAKGARSVAVIKADEAIHEALRWLVTDHLAEAFKLSAVLGPDRQVVWQAVLNRPRQPSEQPGYEASLKAIDKLLSNKRLAVDNLRRNLVKPAKDANSPEQALRMAETDLEQITIYAAITLAEYGEEERGLNMLRTLVERASQAPQPSPHLEALLKGLLRAKDFDGFKVLRGRMTQKAGRAPALNDTELRFLLAAGEIDLAAEELARYGLRDEFIQSRIREGQFEAALRLSDKNSAPRQARLRLDMAEAILDQADTLAAATGNVPPYRKPVSFTPLP